MTFAKYLLLFNHYLMILTQHPLPTVRLPSYMSKINRNIKRECIISCRIVGSTKKQAIKKLIKKEAIKLWRIKHDG